MNESPKTSRRDFVKLAGTGVAGLNAIAFSGTTKILAADPPPRQTSTSANDRIRLATIGHGIIGTIDTATALRVPGVELVAVADVYEGRFTRAKELYPHQFFTTRDYREILARPDVDAVIISTPDHWHTQMAVDAMNAGKDVYLEKPMVHTLDEGRRIIETQQKTRRVLQVGSHFVSSVVYRKAKELLASGVIGELNLVEAWFNRNSALGAWQYYIPPDASKETVDWERFLGSAPKREFEPVRLFRWRNYRDYGTGIAGDLFVHLFSGLHFIINSIGPTRVMSLGGLRHWKDGREVPDVMVGIYEYPKTETHPAFNLALHVNFVSGEGDNYGLRLVGSEGTMTVDNAVTVERRPRVFEPDGYAIPSFPRAMQELHLKESRAKSGESGPQMRNSSDERYAMSSRYDARLDHFNVFFDAMRTRAAVLEDPTFGLRAAGPSLLTNQSYYDNRAYGWDPQEMKVLK